MSVKRVQCICLGVERTRNQSRRCSVLELINGSCFCFILTQCDRVFEGQSHGIKELVSGVIPDYYPTGFHPARNVDADVLYSVYSNVYRKM